MRVLVQPPSLTDAQRPPHLRTIGRCGGRSWASLAAVALAALALGGIGGVQLLSLGIFDEVKQRPLYFVSEMFEAPLVERVPDTGEPAVGAGL